MSVTIRELLKLEDFKDYVVVGGESGLDKEVKAVNVMDAPDVNEWIKGGEIVLTTGYLFRDNLPFLVELIEKINNAGASALFIKEQRFIGKIPACAIEKANELEFPLINMPKYDGFTNVINPVLSKLIFEQTQIIKHHEEIHREFTDIAIKGGDIAMTVKIMAEMLKRNVVFCDVLNDRIYSFPEKVEKAHFMEVRDENYTCMNVYMRHKVCGYIAIKGINYEAKNFELIVIENAMIVIQLILQKELSAMQLERKYRDQFVLDLIFGNISNLVDIENRAKLYKFRVNKNYRAVVFEMKEELRTKKTVCNLDEMEEQKNNIFQYIRKLLADKFSQVMYTQLADSVVFIIEEEYISEAANQNACEIIERVRKKTEETYEVSVRVGVGDVKKIIINISESYREAQYAIKLSEKINEGNTTTVYSEMGMYKLLDKIGGEEEVMSFCRGKLEPLLEYEKKNKAELLQTLISIIDNNWNLKETAQKEFVHYNTIKHRYHKIEEILGINFETVSNKLEVELAIKVYQIYKITEDGI